jgi:Bacterial Ig-like domain
MKRNLSVLLASGGLFLGAVACSGDANGAAEFALLTSVAPVGGATDIDPTTTISVGFSHAVQQGMEQYLAVHEGDLSGSLVAGMWTWSQDGTTWEFTPDAPLKNQMQYMLHVGGGIQDVHGHYVDFADGETHMGGEMIHRDMMNGSMMGQSMMGSGWMHPDGTYGMGFSFMTF